MTDPSPASDVPASPRRRLSLKVQFVVLLCLAMGPAAVIGFLEALSAIRRQSQRADENLYQAAMISVLADRQLIAGARVLLNALAEQPDVRESRQPSCAAVLSQAIARLEEYDSLAITDRTGRVTCATVTPAYVGSFADRAWWSEIMAGQDFTVSPLVTSRMTGTTAVVAAVPIRVDGKTVGGLSVAIRLAALLKRTAEPERHGHPSATLVDENGGGVREPGAESPNHLPAPEVVKAHATPDGDVFHAPGLDGVERLYAVVPVFGDRLLLVATQPLADSFGDSPAYIWVGAAMPLIILLLAIGTIWIGLERLVLRWVSYLRRVGAGYARGHYLVMPRRTEAAPAEIQELARTLSQMALTARARQRDLRAALEQKNTLVREIHHRVKNNLQIIQSLLNLQSRSATDSNQFTALAAAKSRINALALVHQSLYEDENLEYVNLQAFLNELCRHLLQSGWGAAKRVGITVDVPDLVTNADHAVPIALLVTEAVTNALKHAFFGRDVGTITVRLRNDPATGAELTVRDDGIGMDTAPRVKGRQGGIGYSLIEGFARQLRGKIRTVVDNGTSVIVTFPYLRGAGG